MNKYRVIKACILCVLVLLLGSQLYQRPNSKAEFATVASATIKDIDISEFALKDNLGIKKTLGLDPEMFEHVEYYQNTDAMRASEILIVQFKSNDQRNVFEDICQNRIQNQKNIFDGYIEDQADLVNHAVIDICANYAIFVVSPQADEIVKQFEKAL